MDNKQTIGDLIKEHQIMTDQHGPMGVVTEPPAEHSLRELVRLASEIDLYINLVAYENEGITIWKLSFLTKLGAITVHNCSDDDLSKTISFGTDYLSTAVTDSESWYSKYYRDINSITGRAAKLGFKYSVTSEVSNALGRTWQMHFFIHGDHVFTTCEGTVYSFVGHAEAWLIFKENEDIFGEMIDFIYCMIGPSSSDKFAELYGEFTGVTLIGYQHETKTLEYIPYGSTVHRMIHMDVLRNCTHKHGFFPTETQAKHIDEIIHPFLLKAHRNL